MSVSRRGETAAQSSFTAGDNGPAPWRAVYATRGSGLKNISSHGVAIVDVSRPEALTLAMSAEVEDIGGGVAQPVVVVGPDDAEHDMRVAASVLVGHRPGTAVALVLSSHAPLACVLALHAAQDAAADAGHGVAVIEDLLATSWSAFVTDTVAGLDFPAPSLFQHVRSWLPGSRFIVRLGSRPAIVPASRPLLALDGASTRDRVLHMSPPEQERGADVASAIASWTTSKTAEGVLLPDGFGMPPGLGDGIQLALMPAVTEEEIRRPGPPCPICDLTVAASVCPFCHTRLPGAQERGGALVRAA